MSVENNEIKERIEKFNKDSEDIVNKVMDILEGKGHAASIECLSLILVSLIDGVENKEKRDAILNNLIDNLKKCLDKN